MTIKNQYIICDPCTDASEGKYINMADFSERQLSKCVVCYECNQLIWDGEDCWQLKNNCKSCNLDRTFAQG